MSDSEEIDEEVSDVEKEADEADKEAGEGSKDAERDGEADEAVEIEEQGLCARLSDALCGIIIGLVLFLAAVALLFWNEGRTVKYYRALEQGEKLAATIVVNNATAPNGNHDGSPVYFNTTISLRDVLKDADFGIKTAGSMHLYRKAEMYQWLEESKTTTEKNLGGGTTKKTTYSYKKRWSETLVDSSKFHKKENHINPTTMPFQSETWVVDPVNVGVWVMPPRIVGLSWARSNINVNVTNIPDDKLRNSTVQSGRMLYIGSAGSSSSSAAAKSSTPDPKNPAVGDSRIRFQETKTPVQVSVVAMQVGATFAPWPAENGKEVFLARTGEVSLVNMFEGEKASAGMVTWIVRAVGYVMMGLGLYLVARPLEVVADIIPCVGDLVGNLLCCASFTIALAVSFIVGGIVWVFYRPIIGIPLLVVGISSAIGLGIFSGGCKGKGSDGSDHGSSSSGSSSS
uniref:Uncharacterized protein n=1 Tax=Corethron hystrix TaxID=216773 RepID=A0A7S1C0R2_9STRA|mmetsp:Transcript_9529/g.21147  ORF Transcript_9529/g.21147 Transcript_9529/m.21147 type:complete len:456 (+) Transcript_9529:82-1449(+)